MFNHQNLHQKKKHPTEELSILLNITTCSLREMLEKIMKCSQSILAIGMRTKCSCDIWHTSKDATLSVNLLNKWQNVFVQRLNNFLMLLWILLHQVNVFANAGKHFVIDKLQAFLLL